MPKAVNGADEPGRRTVSELTAGGRVSTSLRAASVAPGPGRHDGARAVLRDADDADDADAVRSLTADGTWHRMPAVEISTIVDATGIRVG